MKIFLSGVEGPDPSPAIKKLMDEKIQFNWNLMSFYYINKKNYDYILRVRENSKLILIDSGAHSFQFGKKVDWDEYTKKYAEFIKNFDADNVLGYFEMDVDNIIGYEKVLELRKVLEEVSDKIIPVWHPNRGIAEYKKMCEEYAGKVIAIGGFRRTDIKDEQYIMFLKYAKKFNCKVHCLGMTRKEILDKVPFDFVDSSSWLQCAVYGRTLKGSVKVSKKDYAKTNKQKVFRLNYLQAKELQEHYYQKWRKECKD